MIRATRLGILVLLLAPWLQDGQASQGEAQLELVSPGERSPIAGIGGLAITSKLKSPEAAGAAKERKLQLWLVFPDRARCQVSASDARLGERLLLYRYGPQTWQLDMGEATSRPLAGVAALTVELEFELRRALWLWPDGFDWSPTGSRRVAPVAAPSAAGDVAWFLVARIGEEGRPIEMGLASGSPEADERAGASYRSVAWLQQGDRFFPTSFDFYRGVELQWSEVVEATYRSPQVLEHFFLPPDRKPADTPVRASAPREVRLPARAERREKLDAGVSWELALSRARALAATERARLEPLGIELAQTVIVELDRAAAPRAVLLELVRVPEKLPEGWRLTPESAGLDLRLPGEGPVPVARLDDLHRRLKSTDRADWPFARISTDDRGATRLQLVLPFERESF